MISSFFRIGRKRNFFLCLTTQIVFGTASAFAPNFIVWSVFRFFVGLTVPAILHIPFVICYVQSLVKEVFLKFNSHMLPRLGSGRSWEANSCQLLLEHVLRDGPRRLQRDIVWRETVDVAGISHQLAVHDLLHLHLVSSPCCLLRTACKYALVSFLPESMRWLLAQGRIDEVITMLKHVAVVNKKDVPEEMLKKFKVSIIVYNRA